MDKGLGRQSDFDAIPVEVQADVVFFNFSNCIVFRSDG